MDKQIKKGFERVKKVAGKEETRLVKMDKIRDKKLELDKKKTKR